MSARLLACVAIVSLVLVGQGQSGIWSVPNDQDEARRLIEASNATNPATETQTESNKRLYYTGWAHQSLEQHEKAIAAFEKSVDFSEYRPGIHAYALQLASNIANEELQDVSLSRQYLDRLINVLAEDPVNPEMLSDALRGSAQMAYQDHSVDDPALEAVRLYRHHTDLAMQGVIQDQIASISACFAYAQFLTQSGAPEEGLSTMTSKCQKLAKDTKYEGIAAYLTAYEHYEYGSAEWISALEGAFSKYKEDPASSISIAAALGHHYLSEGAYEDAERWLLEVVEREDPENIFYNKAQRFHALDNLVVLYDLQERRDERDEVLSLISADYPGDEDKLSTREIGNQAGDIETARDNEAFFALIAAGFGLATVIGYLGFRKARLRKK
jgi:tetratricopeptide (TPR) repeat protein